MLLFIKIPCWIWEAGRAITASPRPPVAKRGKCGRWISQGLRRPQWTLRTSITRRDPDGSWQFLFSLKFQSALFPVWPTVVDFLKLPQVGFRTARKNISSRAHRAWTGTFTRGPADTTTTSVPGLNQSCNRPRTPTGTREWDGSY